MKAISNINLCPELTATERQIVLDSKDKKFSEVWLNSKEATEAGIIIFIRECFKDLVQHGVDDKHIQHIAKNLGVEIINNSSFSNLKASEIKTAIRNGIRGEYGDYFGLTIVSINKWLKAFKSDLKRQEAISKQIEYERMLSEPKELDIEKLNADFWAKEEIRIKKFQQTGEFDVNSPRLHLSIYEDSGKIKLSKDDKWDFYNFALKEYYENLQGKVFLPHQREERRLHKEEIQRYDTNELTEQDKANIIQLACANVLKDYYLNFKI